MKLKLPRNYREVIDEHGGIRARIDKLDDAAKPLREREKDLRDQILGWCEQLPPDQDAGLEGHRYALTISERRLERTILSMARLLKRMGLTVFLKGCTMSLKYIQEHLAPVDLKGLISESRTGARVITTSPRLAEAVKRKAA